MRFLNRIRHTWRLSRIEKELTEEIDHHRAMSGGQAMGDIDQALRDATGVWRWRWWDRLGYLRHAARWFARRFWNRPDKAAALIQDLGFCAFAGILFGWRWLTGAPLTGRTEFWFAALYLFCALLQGALQGLVRALCTAGVKPKRVFAENPEEVLELAKLRGYESIHPFNRYRGKWMTISGEFEGFAESFEGDALHVSVRLEDGRRLILRFDRDHGEQIEPLQPGQRIAAIGEIQQVRFELRLESCELVRVEPLRTAPRLTLVS